MRRRLKTVTLCHVRNQQFQMNNLTFFHFFIIHGSLKVYEGLLKSNGGIPLLSELRVLEAIAPDVLEVVKKISYYAEYFLDATNRSKKLS